MLTIFTIPKPFEGHIAIIQRNAMQSWLHLTPSCEVILCGNEAGVAEISKKFGVRHLDSIVCTNYGTPLLSSAFNQVQQIARDRLICYVNADIIFLSNLPKMLERIPFNKFLMCGKRWNLDVPSLIDFKSDDWKTQLAEDIRSHGVLHPYTQRLSAMPRLSIGI